MNQMPTSEKRDRIVAASGTKTARRQARQQARNVLGTSSDGAPGIRAALRAASYLSQIMDDASGGRFRLSVWDARTGDYKSPTVVTNDLARDRTEVID